MGLSDLINSKNFSKLLERSADRSLKILWRAKPGRAGETVPVFIVGAQRSGTTMLGNCLGRSPEIENLGENDTRAFEQNSLKDLNSVSDLVDMSPYRFLIFKPLKDSCSILDLLQLNPTGMAIWMYRDFADRVNSAVKRFGRHPLDVFGNYKKNGTEAWQLIGLDKDDSEFIRSLDIDRLSANDGAALMWYVRNKLFFNLDLQNSSRVRLFSYDAFVNNASHEMESLSDFLKFNFSPRMVAGVHGQSLRKTSPPEIESSIEKLCVSLYERLETVRSMQISS